MIKIKKFGCEYNIDKGSLSTITPAYDGVRVVLRDNTEINFPMTVTSQLKAIIPLVILSNAQNVILDLDAAANGNYSNILIVQENMNNEITNVAITTTAAEETVKPVVKKKRTSKSSTATKKKSVGRPKKTK